MTEKADPMDAVPRFAPGTAATLSVAGPHSIPVSTAIRAGELVIVFALAHSRDSLARLRADPACALCVVAAGLAFTAEGRARVVRERLRAADTVAALALDVERVHDHLADGRTVILDGIRWRWSDSEARERDADVMTELTELAGAL